MAITPSAGGKNTFANDTRSALVHAARSLAEANIHTHAIIVVDKNGTLAVHTNHDQHLLKLLMGVSELKTLLLHTELKRDEHNEAQISVESGIRKTTKNTKRQHRAKNDSPKLPRSRHKS